jgi:uncharacterized protein YecE (DUF72 family)
MSNHAVHIGTSGWSFNWEQFFDEKIPSSKKLKFFSKHFNSVEVNYSFYRLPQAKTFDKWRAQSSEDFIFSVKLSRFITHIKRLDKVKTAFKKFLRRYRHLKEKAGPILLQLAPNFHADAELLKNFLQDTEDSRKDQEMDSLPLAFEFRHESWFDEREETEKILSEFDACLVFPDSSKFPYPEREPVTSKQFVYFRMHGPKELYGSEYGKEGLRKWKEKIENYRKDRDVYIYFNNDGHAYAAKDALALKDMLDAD